ncbi:O-antigen ligase family protein (plasmid) [Bradyrhizobium sp. ISRA443]|uniref:O-antigen ligase family protein n=1 Tax=unclassified Bradyrhizobium TaxID=2631580 RepID=UPI00247990B5|nr:MULTISPECIES: O-antigen ligase family protein [unclassified Bradyrhizobium]WGR90772.1 O-antigen ligase family protein [Bradyrhizobium sp. ISRA435]WGS03096.1 O-antigen ligase family protein [Bradyrhizobium sp. ISRA436]WGS09871.1 O-antigen ligase family protein [Bradyrhizobium sp. ISRA437]WGS16756.1 O-antigen ligase family protein [Bradyrhizobium sp. ISRA443]
MTEDRPDLAGTLLSPRSLLNDPLFERMHLWLFVWSGPQEPRARELRQVFVDILLVVFGAALPWSTTVASVLSVALVIAIPPTLTARAVVAGLRRPPLLLPIVFFALAAIGTIWASDVSWWERLHALDKTSKLLLIPLVFLHFQTSPRPGWTFVSFGLSNSLLLALSFSVYASPALARYIEPHALGVPVKNYIDQSQGFAFLAVTIGGLATEALRRAMFGRTIVLYFSSAAFLANLAFVNVARSAFLYVPIMLLLFAWRYVRGWRLLSVLAIFVIIGLVSLASAPNLQRKIARIPGDLTAYRANSLTVGDDPASGAQRLVFWRSSFVFVRSAPLLGHGTGSTRRLFEAEANGRTGLDSLVVSNPHNQTLSVAIQWGLVGCLALYAMWAVHLWLFRQGVRSASAPFFAWIGLVAVVQNIASSIFNSHLQDFYPGWLYVLAVGIAGGALHRSEIAGSADHRTR